MPARSASASRASSRATETAASSTIWRSSSSRAPAARREVGLERDATALERAHEPGEQIRGARADERDRRLHLRCAHELVDGRHAERRVDLGVELLAQRDSMLARSSARVSNSLAARASSSSSSGSIFSCTSRTVISTVELEPSASGKAICFVSPADAPMSAASISRGEAAAPELDDRVRLRLAFGVDEVDDERVARPGGRSPAGASSATDSRSASISASSDSCGISTSARGTSSLGPVDELGERLHLDGRDEAPGLVRGAGELELVLRVGDRAHAAA